MPRKLLNYFTPLLLLLSIWLMPPRAGWAQGVPEGFNDGPDIITGDIGEAGGVEQFGSDGTQVGLGVSTTSCNAGNVPVNFFALPNTNHPVIPHNLYRMSGGSGNDERFEQIGQSWAKHAFGADQLNACFTCQPGNFTHLGVGCSDTYANFQNATQNDLGSRALINPFTGVFQSTANNHDGHVHTETSHMLLVEGSDLNTTLNPGATYYAEVQYISSDEYAWCQAHPGQCNMYNNVSYRRYNVSGVTSFTFSEVGNAVRMTAAIHAWPGATINPIEPEPGVDGRAFIAYKVTGPVAGVYHYEYALYNENLDRAIQSFSVPLGCAITLSNLGFHAPPNHPGFPNDGTLGDAGFSNAAWSSNQTAGALTWSSETFAQNQNANAIRWGTLYNFRFDSTKPPVATSANIGFFKTGASFSVAILGPNACEGGVSPTPTATASPSATATATPSATATSSATASPSATATPTATPGGAAQPMNFSTRMLVQTGDNVGIGGFIITGSVPKHVLVRAVGPELAQFGVPNPLADPVLELHGPPGFVTIINDNCVPPQIIGPPPLCPPGSLSAIIEATLDPGAYTAIVRGKNNATGVALVEVYDLNQSVDSKLANISTRAFVSTGDNVLVAGFILGGNSGDDRILVRGIGPSLTGFGVPNALADPTLELRDNNGALLAANDNWQDNPIMPVLPPGLEPTRPLESAILVALPPGLYTALLAGVNSTTGVGVVEVYDLTARAGTPSPTPGGTPTPSPTGSPGITPSPTPSPGITPSPTPSATPTPGATKQCTENFDGSPPGGTGGWVISQVDPFSPPNCLFTPDQGSISDVTFDMRTININSNAAVVSFRNNFNTEHDLPPAEVFWDGYVMEISVNGGAYTDIIGAGGVFVSGPYTGEIDGTANNPLAGRMAWSGNSGGYILTEINLPASLNGSAIKLRFRMGSDEATAAPGVRIDDFLLTGGSCL